MNEGEHISGSYRIRGLDGLRALAVIAVFLTHALTSTHSLFIGVDVFFAISGFLITAIVVSQGAGNLRRFYIRRVARLMPALVTVVMVVTAVGGVTGHLHARDALTAITYTSNIIGAIGAQSDPLLGHTWSLGTEEQFYLIWPPLVAAAAARRQLASFTLVAFGLSAYLVIVGAFIAAHTDDTGRLKLYLTPLPHAGALVGGAAVAVLIKGRSTVAEACLGSPVTGILSGLGLVYLATRYDFFSLSVYTVALPVAGLASSLLVGHIVCRQEGRTTRLLDNVALRWLGLRSYGFYLWQYPILKLTEFHTTSEPVVVLVSFVGSLVAAHVSWELIEQPGRRLILRRWASEPPDVEAAAWRAAPAPNDLAEPVTALGMGR